MLDVRQGLTVKGRDPASEAVDEVFELVVGNCAVDIPVSLSEFAIEVLAAEQDLERPAPADQTRQPRRRAASGNSAEANLDLTEHGALAAREADVGGENQLTARGAGSASDCRDRDRGQSAYPYQDVDPGVEAGWASR